MTVLLSFHSIAVETQQVTPEDGIGRDRVVPFLPQYDAFPDSVVVAVDSVCGDVVSNASGAAYNTVSTNRSFQDSLLATLRRRTFDSSHSRAASKSSPFQTSFAPLQS